MSYRDTGKDYFQTSDSLATVERKQAKSKNTHGKPIKFSSKLLALHPDPDDARAIYVAEAAGNIKRVVLETGEKIQVLHATAPLTSIALSDNKLFAGCWDKHIYVTDFSTGVDTRLSGHTDFVKCLVATTINKTAVLISGGADAAIIVWDVKTGQQRYKLKGHTKAVQCLAIDPLSHTETGVDHIELFSSSSDRELRRWRIALDKGHELDESVSSPILAHETGIWQIRFDSNADLWTASADNTAKHLDRERNWQADTSLLHPDFVKDIVVDEQLGLVITACRDEEVRVWDIASSKLVCTYTGHFEEVTALAMTSQHTVVSASIDGTLRRWSLDRAEMQKFAALIQEEGTSETEKPKDVSLTAEEHAELEALMMED